MMKSEDAGFIYETFKRHLFHGSSCWSQDSLDKAAGSWLHPDRARLGELIRVKADQLVINLRSFVYADSVGDVVARYPQDWWQAFRERWFPAWWLKRYPVHYTKVVCSIDATFPEWNPPVSPTGPMVFKQITRTYKEPEDPEDENF